MHIIIAVSATVKRSKLNLMLKTKEQKLTLPELQLARNLAKYNRRKHLTNIQRELTERRESNEEIRPNYVQTHFNDQTCME